MSCLESLALGLSELTGNSRAMTLFLELVSAPLFREGVDQKP